MRSALRPNRLMAMTLVIIGLLAAAGSTPVRADTTITANNSMTCGSPVYATVYKLDCKFSGSTYVLWWDGVTLGGTEWDSSWDGSWTAGYGSHQNQYGTVGHDAVAYMQSDGNFVFYNNSLTTAVWATSTSSSGAYLDLQDDGNVVVYNSSNSPLWSLF